MSATNIQWITIAVLGFGAVFAFFVLVFIFEATVHALRYRDQYAGGGGGFRMPSFGGGRHGGFGSGGESSQPSRQLRKRDPQVDRALAKEAARIAANSRPRQAGESVSLDPDLEDRGPPQLSLVKDDDQDIVELEADQIDDVQPTHVEAVQSTVAELEQNGSSAAISEEQVQTSNLGTRGDQVDSQRESGETADEAPLNAEPLVLTESQEVTLDRPATKSKASRVTMRATKGPLIAAESKFRRHSTQPQQEDANPVEAAQIPAQPGSPTASPQSEAAQLTSSKLGDTSGRNESGTTTASPLPIVESLSTEKQQTEDQVGTLSVAETVAAPADTAPEQTLPEQTLGADISADREPRAPSGEAVVLAEPEEAPGETPQEAPRPSRVVQPSQPESEVMADTTRQLKSLREAEQLGGGLQGGEASCPLYLRYRSASGIVFDRIVQAVSLEEAEGDLVMRAYCHRSKAMRRIRTSNVVASFDLRNRDVAVGEKVPNFLKDRVKMRDGSGQSTSTQNGQSPAAAE